MTFFIEVHNHFMIHALSRGNVKSMATPFLFVLLIFVRTQAITEKCRKHLTLLRYFISKINFALTYNYI